MHQFDESSWTLNFLRTLVRMALADEQSLIFTILVCPSSPMNFAQFYDETLLKRNWGGELVGRDRYS